MTKAVTAVPISAAAYNQFGSLIAADEARQFVLTNLGTAKRYHRLAELINERPNATPNLSVYRCAPYVENPIEIELLERHEFSTQVFLPMSGQRYLAVVCGGAEAPDLKTLAVFLVAGPIGISYRPGVWHHPMIVLDRAADFSCLVWEDGTAQDCQVQTLAEPIAINLPG